MSNKDIISHAYMSDNEHFADAFNYFIYDGKQIIKPDELVSEDATEEAIVQKFGEIVTSKKVRDVIKGVAIKSDSCNTYAILGIENQSDIHYAMPVRNLLYDALNYASQVAHEAKTIKTGKKKTKNAEFLSGFCKEDKIKPVITLVLNWSDKKWDGPVKLSDMMTDMDPVLAKYVNDYSLNLLDPHSIDDFNKFNTVLGDVLEFVKRQDEDDCLRNMVKEKGENWELDIDSINVINTFAKPTIPITNVKEDKMKTTRFTMSLVEEGMDKAVIAQICKKLSKGKTIDVIADEVEEDYEKVKGICDIAEKYAPDYDIEKIYSDMKKDEVRN